MLHENTVQWQVRQAEERLGRPAMTAATSSSRLASRQAALCSSVRASLSTLRSWIPPTIWEMP
jgi:hypothetical protein